MAEIIPPLTRQTLSRMTSGEKRVARRLQSLLEDDHLVCYDIPVGKQRRYPGSIILHPGRGLLFLEVKDWKPATVKKRIGSLKQAPVGWKAIGGGVWSAKLGVDGRRGGF